MPFRPLVVVLVGMLAGLVFYLNALLPNGYLYPFIWPFLAGGIIVYIDLRQTSPSIGIGRSAVMAVETGAVAALVWLAIVMPTYYSTSSSSESATLGLRAIGQDSNGVAQSVRAQMVNFAIAALFFIPLSGLGGVLTRSIVRSGRAGHVPSASIG